MKFNFVALIILFSSGLMGNTLQDTTKKERFDWSKFTFKGAGIVNYYSYNWDTDTLKRNEFDTERFNVYIGYDYSDNIIFKSEIEIEHGGTGVTKEFDRFEEFGEFETEVEAGGEVILEQLNVLFKINPYFNIRVGRLKVYMGLAAKLDEPTDYFTTYRSEMENALIPTQWYENGIEISGAFGNKRNIKYKAYIISGLDGTGFSSRNFIKRGHQKRFETIFADALAFAARLDYHYGGDNFVGISSYIGNSTPNRPKKDLNSDAYVNITDLHFKHHFDNFKIRGMVLYGTLQNSDRVSDANRNLSNNLNVKRTPVGSAALGIFIEGAYNILSLWNQKKELDVFARYDFYDSMYKVAGGIFDNPRWERSSITTGFNYFPHNKIVLKVHYSYRTLGLIDRNHEQTFSLGIGFQF